MIVYHVNNPRKCAQCIAISFSLILFYVMLKLFFSKQQKYFWLKYYFFLLCWIESQGWLCFAILSATRDVAYISKVTSSGAFHNYQELLMVEELQTFCKKKKSSEFAVKWKYKPHLITLFLSDWHKIGRRYCLCISLCTTLKSFGRLCFSIYCLSERRIWLITNSIFNLFPPCFNRLHIFRLMILQMRSIKVIQSLWKHRSGSLG